MQNTYTRTAKMKLDLYDQKILYELDRDTRQSNKQIAKKVGLSEQVTGNRIKRLIENKIIDYFYVKTNPSTLGYFHIKFYLRMHNITNEKYQQLIQELIFFVSNIMHPKIEFY